MLKSDVIKRLQEKACAISFKKSDGSIRWMWATLHEPFLPEKSVEGKSKRKKNEDIQVVFDTEVESWRSFRWDSLISVDGDRFIQDE